jgi:hypothetical protein
VVSRPWGPRSCSLGQESRGRLRRTRHARVRSDTVCLTSRTESDGSLKGGPKHRVLLDDLEAGREESRPWSHLESSDPAVMLHTTSDHEHAWERTRPTCVRVVPPLADLPLCVSSDLRFQRTDLMPPAPAPWRTHPALAPLPVTLGPYISPTSDLPCSSVQIASWHVRPVRSEAACMTTSSPLHGGCAGLCPDLTPQPSDLDSPRTSTLLLLDFMSRLKVIMQPRSHGPDTKVDKRKTRGGVMGDQSVLTNPYLKCIASKPRQARQGLPPRLVGAR